MIFQEFFVKILLGVFVETMFERWWKWYNTSDNSCNNNINSSNNKKINWELFFSSADFFHSMAAALLFHCRFYILSPRKLKRPKKEKEQRKRKKEK